MKEKLRDAFDALKELEIRATPRNVQILNAVYNTLREIYAEMEEAERRETDGQAADPGGRDED